MSKLLNAPLQEVIFEIRWNIESKNDLESFQFISGDIYSSLKGKYPFRKSINPPDIPLEILVNSPLYQFRTSENGYPLIQIGPGVLTFNSDDENYFWDKFYSKSIELADVFEKSFQGKESKKFRANLIYLDFFEFNFLDDDVFKYLNNHFNLNINQTFLETNSLPNSLNLSFNYATEFGNLTVHFRKGKQVQKSTKELKEGIILQTHLGGEPMALSVDGISKWLEESHNFCSGLFKKMTEGNLYNSFN